MKFNGSSSPQGAALRFGRFSQLAILWGAILAQTLAWGVRPGYSLDQQEQPQTTTKGVVVSVSGPASDVGAAVLSRGGNAVDAAVATAFALAVTHPEAGNIGGGGYLLYHPGPEGEPAAYDFREVAPAAATGEMFVSLEGRTAHRRVGVPGTVRGLALAHAQHGKLAWKELVTPAVRLAKKGFALDAATAESLNLLLSTSLSPEHAELRRVFSKPDGTPWKAGDRLVQPDLGASLTLIADEGPDAFYTGAIADKIVAEMQTGRGLITKEDLNAYQPLRRTPLRGSYRGYEIHCMPPSSSGGTTLLEELNILENFDLQKEGRWSASTVHLMVEAMRRAYRDRAAYLGDPAFCTIPEKLTDKQYAQQLAKGINPEHATPSAELAGDIPLAKEFKQTTHLSVVDPQGAAVSLTYTLEQSYGSRIVVKGAGFILNDEMNDFVWVPGVTDTWGQIGTLPNQIAPGKRMLSSICPAIVTHDGKLVLVTGSPGGRRIINIVLCVIVNVLDFGMEIQAAVDAPRIHHQWFPDTIQVEPELIEDHPGLVTQLKKLGHSVETTLHQGDAHSIWIDPQTGQPVGAPDRRISGKASYSE